MTRQGFSSLHIINICLLGSILILGISLAVRNILIYMITLHIKGKIIYMIGCIMTLKILKVYMPQVIKL